MYEVSLRDGLQNEKGFVPTADKKRMLEALLAAGLRRLELTPARHGEVFVLRGEIDALADPRIVEELLDHDEAADQVADLRRNDRDRREECVAQDVSAHHRPYAQALQHRSARVVGAERLDRARSRHAVV